MAADLVALARDFVETSAQLERIRNAMRLALGNGIDAAANPTSPPVRPGGTAKRAKQPSRDTMLARSQEIDRQVLAMIRDQPMRTSDLARATTSKPSTTTQRMQRLMAKGVVQRGDGGAWSVSETRTAT
jgi:hypothetical protein